MQAKDSNFMTKSMELKVLVKFLGLWRSQSFPNYCKWKLHPNTVTSAFVIAEVRAESSVLEIFENNDHHLDPAHLFLEPSN